MKININVGKSNQEQHNSKVNELRNTNVLLLNNNIKLVNKVNDLIDTNVLLCEEVKKLKDENILYRKEIKEIKPYADAYKRVCQSLGIKNNILSFIKEKLERLVK